MIKKWMTAAALLAMVGTVSPATLYTTGVLDFNKTTKGSYLGKIGAAVPVTVLKKTRQSVLRSHFRVDACRISFHDLCRTRRSH